MTFRNLIKQSSTLYFKNFFKLIFPWTSVLIASFLPNLPFPMASFLKFCVYTIFLIIAYHILFPKREPLSLNVIKTRLLRYILTNIYVVCKVLLGLMFFIIPGVISIFKLSFANYIALFYPKTVNPIQASKSVFNYGKPLIIKTIIFSIMLYFILSLRSQFAILLIRDFKVNFSSFIIIFEIMSLFITSYVIFLNLFLLSSVLAEYNYLNESMESYNNPFPNILSILGLLCLIVIMIFVLFLGLLYLLKFYTPGY